MRKTNLELSGSLNDDQSPVGFGRVDTVPGFIERGVTPNMPKPLSETALASVRDDQTQTQTPQSWSQYFADKFSFFPYVARTYNVIFYALVVTCVFVLLAMQRANGQNDWAAIYAASSAMFNYPMAIAFNEQLVKFFQGIGKKQLSYILSFAAGLALALETTVAGLAVAEEAVNKVGKDLPNSCGFLIYYAIFTFCMNTFATRAVGATNFLHGTYVDGRNFVYRHFLGKGAYFNLADDLKRHWDQVSGQMILGRGSEQSFVESFYNQLAEQQVVPTSTFSERAKQALEFMAVNVPRTLAFFLLPMWIGLAQNGWRLTGALFGNSAIADNNLAVWSAAMSSWLFYMRSSGTFAPSALKFQQGAKEHLEAVFKRLESLSPAFAKGATYFSLAAGWGLILFSAGCSGSGFAVVMHDQLHPAPGTIPSNSTDPYAGFGSAATPLFQVVPFEWAFRHLIVPIGGYSALLASGVFINGGSFVGFISDCWKIQKDSDCSFRQALLKKMFGIEPKKVTPAEEVVDAREEVSRDVAIPVKNVVPRENAVSQELEGKRKKFISAVENCEFRDLTVATNVVEKERSRYHAAMFSSRKTAVESTETSLLPENAAINYRYSTV